MHSKRGLSDQGVQARSFVEDARRRQIVDAAIDAIAEFGYADVSFTKIAARVGISPSLISYHFSGKADLVETAAATINARLDAALSESMAAAAGHLAAARALATGFVGYVDRHRSQMLALWQLSVGLSEAEQAGLPGLDAEEDNAELSALVRAGQQAGEFREGDARTLAALTQGLLNAAARELFTCPGVNVERLGLELAAAVERVLRAEGARQTESSRKEG